MRLFQLTLAQCLLCSIQIQFPPAGSQGTDRSSSSSPGIGLGVSSSHLPHIQEVVTQSVKGIESKFIRHYQPEGDDTRLLVEVEYIVPVPLSGKPAGCYLQSSCKIKVR